MAGLKGRSGRAPRSVEQNLHSLLDSHWPIADRIQVIKTLHKNAIEGSYQAASLLLAYAYGKPTERIEHSLQIQQANKAFLKLKEEFPEIEDAQLREWFAPMMGIQPEQIEGVQ